MNFIDKDTLKTQFLKVSHDLQRRILEMPSFIRVLNNYYYLKTRIQNQIKPLVLSNLKKSIQTLEFERDWIYSIPSKLTRTSDDYLTTKDSFKFPDSIILFEAWMNLGIRALFPRTAFHYRFPGFLKGEKIRNLIQFTFATSRGFGFPIYFGPEFYQYKLTYGKFLEAIFKWSHTVCHRANQAINLVGNRYRIERHHPGEFESVIISEFEKGNFKTIDTLLHGYFTNAPKKLGQFSNLNSVLEKVVFSYSIGDHAMSTKLINQEKVLEVPLITYEDIVKRYNINFFSYISKLKAFRLLLIKKIILYKQQKKELLSKIKISNKSKSRLSSRQLTLNIKIMEKLLQMLWITPLYTHTYHRKEVYNLKTIRFDSIFLEYIKTQELKWDIEFQETEIITKLEDLKNHMLAMWTPFKNNHFNYAIKKLNELANLSLSHKEYFSLINEYLDNLTPIFSIYEIFNRSLSESVYPESIPQTKRLGAYFARFLSSKYNIFGVNLMHLFNKLSYNNWSYLIYKKKLSMHKLFNLILNLPIWKYVPKRIKRRILDSNLEYIR